MADKNLFHVTRHQTVWGVEGEGNQRGSKGFKVKTLQIATHSQKGVKSCSEKLRKILVENMKVLHGLGLISRGMREKTKTLFLSNH